MHGRGVIDMTNAEKFAQVFGIDLPVQVFCTHELTEDCKRCLELTTCEAWLNAEYKGDSDVD